MVLNSGSNLNLNLLNQVQEVLGSGSAKKCPNPNRTGPRPVYSNIPYHTKLTKVIFDTFEQEVGFLTAEMQVSILEISSDSPMLTHILDRQQFLTYASQPICGLIPTLLATYQLHHITTFKTKMVTGKNVVI